MARSSAQPIKYFSRNSLPISKEQFDEFAANPEYVNVRKFDNLEVRVILKWVGQVRGTYFPGEYPIFQMAIWNYGSDGELRVDPQSGKTYSDEEDAIKAYDAFVEQWTESYVNDKGVLVEVDNMLAPELPPSPDAPASDLSTIKGLTDDDVGAW